jgi:argininosuccinate lyase
VAGTGFAIDRERVAERLGFAGAMRNSIDATGSRDFAMEVSCALSILGVHLSRIGEEIVIWSTQEFGFLKLSDAFATSSSMMPQKKNPDVAELVRGKSARLLGSTVSLLTLEKNLAFGYGRDLQEDKPPLFDAFDSALLSLHALAGAIRTASFNRMRLRAALEGGHLCATDLADFLVLQGMPFREAHHVVGGLVRLAEERGVDLADLPDSELAKVHAALGTPEARQALNPELAVERRNVLGGPARVRVVEAISEARQRWAF